MRVLRAMKADKDGRPEFGRTARTLGVRIGGGTQDIATAASGYVLPETGGVSVSPPPPENLPEHRRPGEYGGAGRDPVWELATDNLPSELAYRADPGQPYRHGFIEPAEPMLLDLYETHLRGTRDLWRPFGSPRATTTLR